jgi:selenocysteine-specific elongation factor
VTSLAPRVVGTAGHIDHGKTALVEALTGVWTDRLPEEKERGISIDLGFAPLDLGPDTPPVSIVDVPGHEAFVKNMVAGATGIDAVLLVVAADEGMMPQTREHLLVLEALGVTRGIVAITKADLVEREWIDLVVETIREELSPTPLAGSRVVVVSSRTGEGMDQMRSALADLLAETPRRSSDLPFRLPVDRSFGLAGAGTVVTGTVWSGSMAEGETAVVFPAGERARVRSIQVHGRAVGQAEAGRRAAIALAGLEADRIGRGSTLVGEDPPWRAVARVDAQVWLARSASRRLLSGARVRVHHGTSEVMARLRPYDGRSIDPGGEALALLDLEGPIVPAVGDRIVLRAYSPVATVGGGEILALDPPRVRGALRAERGRSLAVLSAARGGARLQVALEAAGAEGIEERALPLAVGLGETALAEAMMESAGQIERHGSRWFARAARIELYDRLLEILSAHHATEPLKPGLPLEAARQRLGGRARGVVPDPALVEAVVAGRDGVGRVRREGTILALAEHRVELGVEDERLVERLRTAYAESGIEPPDTRELAARLDVEARRLRELQGYLEREGEIVKLASDWYADASALARAERSLVDRLAAAGSAETAAFKDLFGVSRKYLIPLLEYFDRRGITRREGNRRVLA